MFLGLAGDLTSASHRRLRTSLPATILIGGSTAAVVAVAVTDPPAPAGAARPRLPAPEIEDHLRELGFRRIVGADRSQSQGVCSFPRNPR